MSQHPSNFIRVPFAEMRDTFQAVLIRYGLPGHKATTCAEIFATNSLEGVYTHGVNRFARFISYLKKGDISIDAEPSLTSRAGAIEQWNGNAGPGPLNALWCTERAIEVSRQHGMGCVALANTNHWMRGGTYGWHAAKAGYVFIGWTNTMGNMPAWGAVDSKLGNNPLVIAVPYQQSAIVLDMAMSQYSYGSLDLYQLKNEKLPVPGGYDQEGRLTQDAGAIMASRRALPVGFWKGAGLSLLLDILATILSGGLSTSQISKKDTESALSQIFIAIDISKLSNYPVIAKAIDEIIGDYHASIPDSNTKQVRYPGEKIEHLRHENGTQGIPVSSKVWEEIKGL